MIAGELFRIGELRVTGYGVGVTLGAILGIMLLIYCAKRCGVKKEQAEVYAICAVPLCLIFARLGYCLVRFYFVRDDMGFMWIFRLWDGGFLLYGALIGGLIAALLAGKIAKCSPVSLLDAAAPAAALVIAVCRFSEGFVGLGKGWEIENEALAFFPLGVWDSYQEWWFWSLFLLEGLCALGLCLYLMKKPRAGARKGDSALMLLLCYAAMQLTLESMRTDGVLKWGMVRCSQLFSALTVGTVLLIYCSMLKKQGQLKLLCWLGVLALFGIIMAMEFAIEDKIAFITRFLRDVMGISETKYKLLCCYGVMGLCSAAVIFVVTRVRNAVCAATASHPATQA